MVQEEQTLKFSFPHKTIINDAARKIVNITLESNATVQVPEINFNETASSNSTILQSNNTIFKETSDSNSTSVTTVTNFLSETSDSNSTSVTTVTNFLSEITDSVAETVTGTMETVVTATEASVKKITEAFTAMTTSEENQKRPREIDDKTLYIALGVFLAMLIVLIVAFSIIYKKYRDRHGPRSGVYCVNHFNDRNPNSRNMKGVNQHQV